MLPEYGPAEYEVAESEEDQVRNNEVLNAAIAGLFGVLKGWESDDAVGGCGKSRLRRLELTLFQMYSPGDAKRHRWVVKQLHEARMFLANITIRERLPGSTLGVLRVDELPELGIIRKFVASPMYQRRVDAASIARLAGKFSALEEVDLDVDADWDLEEMRGRRYGTYCSSFFSLIETLAFLIQLQPPFQSCGNPHAPFFSLSFYFPERENENTLCTAFSNVQ